MNNKLDESLNLFNKKCAKLDIPPDCCPEQNYLQKILRQRLSLFESFINKADAKNDVDRVRKTILIQLKLSENNLSRNAKVVPKEYNNYVKHKVLLDKSKSLHAHNQNLKQQESQKLQTIQRNDLRHAKAKATMKVNKSKLDLLQAKTIQLDESITKEKKLDEKIYKVTPKKFSANDNTEQQIKKINESIDILKKFSQSTAENTMIGTHMAKEKFWSEVSDKISNVPNVVLFQLILKEISARTDSINSLTSASNELKRTSSTNTHKISDKLLPLLYEHKIVSGIELLSLKKKLSYIKSTCASNIQTLENEMDVLLNATMDFSFQLEDDDIIGDFVTALIAKLNCEGKNQFCMNAISLLKQQINSNANLSEYERVLNETKEIYSLTDEKILSVQEHVAQVHQINEKINFSKISLMRMIQSLKMEKSQQHNRTLMNQTLNSTIMSVSNKLSEVNLPTHESELQGFLDIEMHKIEKGMKMDQPFLITDDDKLMSNLMVPTKHFLFPQEYLLHMEKSLKIADSLKQLALDLESNVPNMTDIDFDSMEKQHDENYEEISAMLDSTTRFNVQTNSHLRNISTLYEYGMKNPLRKFIPSSKRYLEKTYGEYEKDYMLYYNMIKN